MANYGSPKKGQNKHNANAQYKYSILQDLRADRQIQARVRIEMAAKRSPEEQMRRLDAGGFVAKKERAKLQARMKVVAKVPDNAPAPQQDAPKSKKGRKSQATA